MPSIEPGSKVLVSGANGYIAMWVVRTLLEEGYVVRGTVRSLDKGKHLQETFAEYGNKFELAVVEDITKDGAFDEVVIGVDAVEHTASPVHLTADDPQELIKPAVKGTVGILQSVLKNGSAVKRVVITSSIAAVLHLSPTPQTFSEVDWNDQSVKMIKEEGRNATGMAKYRASKTLAEKAAWAFYEENKSLIQWDLTVLNPPYVLGPVIHSVSRAENLNVSTRDFYDVVVRPDSGGKSNETLATEGSSWVDVRDLAEAHVLALQKEEAGGERMLISAGPFMWQDWLDSANSLIPSPIPSHTLPKGNPGSGRNAVHMKHFDTSKASRILGMKYRAQEETTRDALADFEAKRF